jgi:hypothetical protein
MSTLTKVQAVMARHALLWVHNEAMHLRTVAIQIEEGLPEWRAEVKSDDLRRRVDAMIDALTGLRKDLGNEAGGNGDA